MKWGSMGTGWEVINLITNNVPISEKYNLTIAEATEYFNIGRDKLYELAREDGCKFVIHNGRNILIKRKAFEKFLEQAIFIWKIDKDQVGWYNNTMNLVFS